MKNDKKKRRHKHIGQFFKKYQYPLLLASVCLLATGIYTGKHLMDSEEAQQTVSAAPLPNSPAVVVDAADPASFNVPADATTKYESVLPAGYLQNNDYLRNLLKGTINTYSSDVDDQARYVGTLSNGDLIFIDESTSAYLQPDYGQMFVFRKVIIKTDPTGSYIKETYLANGENTYTPYALFAAPISESSRDYWNPLIAADDTIMGMYLGTTPTTTSDDYYAYKFDGTTFSKSSYNRQPRIKQGTSYRAYTLGQMGEIINKNDGKYYFDGGMFNTINSAATNTNNTEFCLVEADPVAGTETGTNVTFRIKKYTEAVPTFTPSEANWGAVCMYKLLYNNGYYYGIVRYYKFTSKATADFDESIFVYKWDANGNYVDDIRISDRDKNLPYYTYNFIEGLTKADPNHYYYVDYSGGTAKVQKLNLTTMVPTTIVTFPKGTYVHNIVPNAEGRYDFYITAEDAAVANPMLSPYMAAAGVGVGELNADFTIYALSYVKATGTVVVNSLEPIQGSDYLAIAGHATLDSDLLEGPFDKWPAAYRSSFYGTLEKFQNYAPGIKFTDDNLIIDITDSMATIEAQLMSDVEVTDTYDLHPMNVSGAKTQAWLDERLNRNPNKITYQSDGLTVSGSLPAIDWAALGFDKTERGPQAIKYFLTDSTNLTSAASRWINNTTPQTVIEEDYALDAQNFHVPLSSVASDIPDDEAFKKLAQSLAWHADGTHTVHEDAVNNQFDASKVTVDATQLAAVQAAAEAKPYPVDITYDPKGDGSILVVNRVWVFVTTKNTAPNNESIYTEVTPEDTNGVAYYANDYSIPLRIAKTHVVQDVLERGDIKVYDYYDTTHETDADCDYDAATGEYNLPTLADANKNASRLDITNMTVITGATGACVVQPDVTYEWLETPTNIYHTQNVITHGTLDVTITADVLLHVRQVIYNDHQDVVIPTEGYLTLKNTPDNTMAAIVASGKETGVAATEPSYDTFAAAIDNLNGNNLLDVLVTVPEFYEYKGYVVTDTNTIHNSSMLTGGTYQYDFTSGVYEKWLTVYLTPKLNSTNLPQPYSWDYRLNEFGDIEVE